MIARRAKHPVSEHFGKECSCSLCKNGPPTLSNRLKVVLSSSCVSEHFRWIDFWLGMYTPPTFKWKFPFPGVCFPNLPIIYLLYISGIEISSQWHQHHFYQTSVNGTLLDKNILHLCMTYIYIYPHTYPPILQWLLQKVPSRYPSKVSHLEGVSFLILNPSLLGLLVLTPSKA